jgi:alpha-mannosidase
VREGYRTNLPVRTVTGSTAPEPLVRVDGGEAVVEAVKLADDGSGDVVVRLYEPLGGRTTGSLVPGFAAGEMLEVDLLERPISEGGTGAVGRVVDGTSKLSLRPFQVLTVRVRRAAV